MARLEGLLVAIEDGVVHARTLTLPPASGHSPKVARTAPIRTIRGGPAAGST